MDGAGWKPPPPLPPTHRRKHPPLLPNTRWTGRERKREKCLLPSSTSFSWRSGGQVTFMETLFLDCCLARLHYSSAPPLKLKILSLPNVSVCKWGLSRSIACHVLFKVVATFFLCPRPSVFLSFLLCFFSHFFAFFFLTPSIPFFLFFALFVFSCLQTTWQCSPTARPQTVSSCDNNEF